MMTNKIKCALIGPGNIGTDLLAKLQRSPVLEPVWMVGIDPESDGLKRAREMGIKTTAEGVDGLVPHMKADGVQIVFDATSGLRARRELAQGQCRRRADDRPHARGHRPVLRAAREPAPNTSARVR
jgi:acetaldehyde dehydrogenase (acetylating)